MLSGTRKPDLARINHDNEMEEGMHISFSFICVSSRFFVASCLSCRSDSDDASRDLSENEVANGKGKKNKIK